MGCGSSSSVGDAGASGGQDQVQPVLGTDQPSLHTNGTDSTKKEATSLSTDSSLSPSRPNQASAVTAEELISGGILLLSIAAEHCPFPGSEAVAVVLKQIYTIFNSAASKTRWMADFMVYLRNIECEMIAAAAVFREPYYCEKLAARLRQSQQILESMTNRNRVLGVLTAVQDEQTLLNERKELEDLKVAAMMSIMNEVKEDTNANIQQANNINALLGGASIATHATHPSTVSSSSIILAVSSPSSSSSSNAATNVNISNGLAAVNQFAGMAGTSDVASICGILAQCYVMWQSARTRKEWQEDFVGYLRQVDKELQTNAQQFGDATQPYLKRLSTQLKQSQRILEMILTQNQYLGFITASSDQKKLQNERIALEQIKSESLNLMLTKIKGDTSATVTAVEEMQRRLAETESEMARARAAYATAAAKEAQQAEMKSKLLPLDYAIDVNSELKKYMPGTRLSILAKVESWLLQKDPSVDMSSRVFWLKGGPGVGKTCISALICDQYPQQLLGIHFCRHDMEMRKDARRMVRSLAYQVAQRIPAYYELLKGIIPAIFGSGSSNLSAVELWDQLLVQPLSKIQLPTVSNDTRGDGSSPVSNRYALLIDALDESVVRNGTSSELLDILSTGVTNLPSWLGVIITSRPESYILLKLKKFKPQDLSCESEENLQDLRIYLSHFLKSAVSPKVLEYAVDILLQKCSGLILCARLMVHAHGLFPHDQPDDWSGRDYSKEPLTLTELNTWPAGLDAFYFEAMQRIKVRMETVKGVKSVDFLGQTVPADLLIIRQLMECILSAYEPLTLQCLSDMTNQSNYSAVMRLLAPLRSLLPLAPAVTPSDEAPPAEPVLNGDSTVSVYHKSVKDWFLSIERQADEEHRIYYLDYYLIHRIMTERCFTRLVATDSNAIGLSSCSTQIQEMITQHQQKLIDQPVTLVPSPPLLVVSEVMNQAARDSCRPEETLRFDLSELTHPSHPHPIVRRAAKYPFTDKITCGTCQREERKMGEFREYLCPTCSQGLYDQLLTEEANVWNTDVELKIDGADGDAKRWLKAEHRLPLCDRCMSEPLKKFKEKESQLRQTVRSTVTKPFSLKSSSFLSYAIRRGPSHGLDSTSLLHTAAFLCHLQYLQMRLLLPDESASLAAVFIRAQNEKLVYQKPDSASTSSFSWLLQGLPAEVNQSSWLEQTLSIFANFYSTQSHHFIGRTEYLYQDALMLPTATAVCQQAYQLLPWTTRSTASSSATNSSAAAASTPAITQNGLLHSPLKPQHLPSLLQVLSTGTNVDNVRLIHSSNGDFLVTYSYPTMTIWRTSTGEALSVHRDEQASFDRMVLSRDNSRLITSYDIDPTTKRILVFNALAQESLDLETGELIGSADSSVTPTQECIFSTFLNDELGGQDTRFLTVYEQHVDREAHPAEGGVLCLWRVPTGNLIEKPVVLDRQQLSPGPLLMVAAAPSHQYFVSMVKFDQIQLWSAASGPSSLQCLTTIELPIPEDVDQSAEFDKDHREFCHLTWSADSTRLAISYAAPRTDEDLVSSLFICAVEDGKLVLKVQNLGVQPCAGGVRGRITALQFMNSQELIAGLSTKSIPADDSEPVEVDAVEILSVETGLSLRRLLLLHEPVHFLRIDPAGSRLSILMHWDARVTEYELASGRLLQTHAGVGRTNRGVSQIEYVNMKQTNGQVETRLLTSNYDGRVCLWHVADVAAPKNKLVQGEKAPLTLSGEISTCNLSLCGRYLIIKLISHLDETHSMTIWDWRTGPEPMLLSTHEVDVMDDADEFSRAHFYLPTFHSHDLTTSTNGTSFIIQALEDSSISWTRYLKLNDSTPCRVWTLPEFRLASAKQVRSFWSEEDQLKSLVSEAVLVQYGAGPPGPQDFSIPVGLRPSSSHLHDLCSSLLQRLQSRQIHGTGELDSQNKPRPFFTIWGNGVTQDLLFLADRSQQPLHGIFIYSTRDRRLLQRIPLMQAIRLIRFDGEFQQLWILADDNGDYRVSVFSIQLESNAASSTSSSNPSSTNGPVARLVGSCLTASPPSFYEIPLLPFGRSCFLSCDMFYPIIRCQHLSGRVIFELRFTTKFTGGISLTPEFQTLVLVQNEAQTVIILHLSKQMTPAGIDGLIEGERNNTSVPITSHLLQPYRTYSFDPPTLFDQPPGFIHLYALD